MRLDGAGIVETIVALTIISTLFLLTATIFISTQRPDLTSVKITAIGIVDSCIRQDVSNRAFYKSMFEINGFIIERQVQVVGENIFLLEYEVYRNNLFIDKVREISYVFEE